MRVKLVPMTGWMTRTALCIALLMSAASLVLAGETSTDGPPPAAEATYDATQPGADDPRVREGFDAYKAGDFKKAYDIWLPLANAGNAEAQYRLGNLYSFARGVEKNYKSASYWWEQATDVNHLRAMFNLAQLMMIGPESLINYSKATRLFAKAAECGHVRSQLFYGIALASGAGIDQDYEAAFMWLYIAHRNGSASAEYSIQRLLNISNEETRVLGEKKMREWFENHSRKCE